jgi:hypothetical protein
VTAPEKSILTRARVRWFAAYLRRHPTWGIFRAALALHDFESGAAAELPSQPWSAADREAAAWFDALSSSQRRRLVVRAEDLAHDALWKAEAS